MTSQPKQLWSAPPTTHLTRGRAIVQEATSPTPSTTSQRSAVSSSRLTPTSLEPTVVRLDIQPLLASARTVTGSSLGMESTIFIVLVWQQHKSRPYWWLMDPWWLEFTLILGSATTVVGHIRAAQPTLLLTSTTPSCSTAGTAAATGWSATSGAQPGESAETWSSAAPTIAEWALSWATSRWPTKTPMSR